MGVLVMLAAVLLGWAILDVGEASCLGPVASVARRNVCRLTNIYQAPDIASQAKKAL
jgi:hypothetical protein